jgi:hypothetical protein
MTHEKMLIKISGMLLGIVFMENIKTVRIKRISRYKTCLRF